MQRIKLFCHNFVFIRGRPTGAVQGAAGEGADSESGPDPPRGRHPEVPYRGLGLLRPRVLPSGEGGNQTGKPQETSGFPLSRVPGTGHGETHLETNERYIVIYIPSSSLFVKLSCVYGFNYFFLYMYMYLEFQILRGLLRIM